MINKSVRDKKTAAILSVISNFSLIVLKVIVGIISGSISIISEAIHSGSDLLASLITFFSISEATKPADEEHQFGHGKYEDLASFIEGSLIILAGLYIIYQSIKKILLPMNIHIDADLGIAVMFISIIVNIFVSAYLFKTAKKTSSSALYADGEHLRTDIYSSLAVFIGLFLVKYTGQAIFDPLIAIVVASIILVAGYKICAKSQQSLLDTSLSEEENEKIKEIVERYMQNGIILLKQLKTRKAGLIKNIEITLVVRKTMHISTSHEICDKIEAEIDSELKNTDISIHLEPDD